MPRLSCIVITAFAIGFIAALVTVSGCSRIASRKLTLFQYQNTKAYDGHFRLDTSELPPGAIESMKQSGERGAPETQLTLNRDYSIEVVVRLAEARKKIPKQVGGTR